MARSTTSTTRDKQSLLPPIVLRHNKRLRSTALQSPSYCEWKELDAIGKALLGRPDSDDDRAAMTTKEALERIAVWKVHSTKIAHAVESTAALAQILLREKTDGRASDGATTTELRLAYACAIIRAINGLADSLQQQRSMACSVAILCTELGVPAWLVAIRHEATHNQLPPLPTLRMGANALLQYFSTVYWEPMVRSRNDAYDHAMSLLRGYEDAAMEADEEKNRGKTTYKTAGEEQSVDDESCGSDDEEAFTIEGLWQPKPGTTSNRFALLLEERSKKKKAVPPLSAPTANAEPATRESVPTLRDLGRQTTSVWAQEYVKAKIPIDIAYCAAIDFLVARSVECSNRDMGCRGNFDENSVSRYRPLLSALGRTWPGFLVALLVACVDQVLMHENVGPMADTADSSCRLLELWVHYLLSRKFLGQFDASAKVVAKKAVNEKLADIAPLAALQGLQFPLNRLCDRCSGSDEIATNRQRSARYRLRELFEDILGDERVPNNGVDMTRAHLSNPRSDANVSKLDATTMSLDAMEALLSGDPGVAALARSGCIASTRPGPTDTTMNARHVAWVRCTTWEPCAIGAPP